MREHARDPLPELLEHERALGELARGEAPQAAGRNIHQPVPDGGGGPGRHAPVRPKQRAGPEQRQAHPGDGQQRQREDGAGENAAVLGRQPPFDEGANRKRRSERQHRGRQTRREEPQDVEPGAAKGQPRHVPGGRTAWQRGAEGPGVVLQQAGAPGVEPNGNALGADHPVAAEAPRNQRHGAAAAGAPREQRAAVAAPPAPPRRQPHAARAYVRRVHDLGQRDRRSLLPGAPAGRAGQAEPDALPPAYGVQNIHQLRLRIARRTELGIHGPGELRGRALGLAAPQRGALALQVRRIHRRQHAVELFGIEKQAMEPHEGVEQASPVHQLDGRPHGDAALAERLQPGPGR